MKAKLASMLYVLYIVTRYTLFITTRALHVVYSAPIILRDLRFVCLFDIEGSDQEIALTCISNALEQN